ncbi:release factor glutamine methyltransferase [Lutibacter oricola]|uniref:Release factor glutamine methyltransferase n=1 Tax=Lutibacter oricola TaxID=762486 RepID=A0A1H3CD05_9FLAO|nr:peptide chain release factor N(5)-glutamine methyltransferase [Lutibacter oricola]SDX52072.1 release factor glutamine methyltransferase [Lutibacter oricola]
MLIKEFKNQFFTDLKGLYPQTEIQSFFNLIIEYKLGLTRIDVALQPEFDILENDVTFLNNALIKLSKSTPIQYILGETEFFDLVFKTNSNVLIPRPETAELVQSIIDDHKNSGEIKILDIGTGSGCIAISLAKNLPNAKVYAIDVSAEALKTATENAILNNASVKFIETDILNSEELPGNFDVIVSNPPYVREAEKQHMEKNVLDNEPHLALFVEDDNPLIFYNKIGDLAKNHLTKNGNLYFEINQYLGKETAELISQKGFKNVQIKKDIFGEDRMLKSSI